MTFTDQFGRKLSKLKPIPKLKLVGLPVDVSDAERFPNIVAAIDQARELRKAAK